MKPHAFWFVVIAVMISADAMAAPLPPTRPNPDKIEGYCGENGGVYWPPGPESDTYGCLLPDGTLVLCEGGDCDTFLASEGLPTGKLPLAIVPVIQQVQTETRLADLSSKLQQLQIQMDDLAILVEDECEPPIFVP